MCYNPSMSYILMPLGNPGREYEGTRHNTGKIVNDLIKGKIDPQNFKILDSPEFMNNSGRAASRTIKSKKAAEKLIVVHDDLDLPLGTFKVSFDRGPGGHRGVASVIRALKTEAFIRVRVGVSPVTPSGKLRKPKGEKAVLDFILGKFKPKELEVLKKVSKKIGEAVSLIVSNGREAAQSKFN